MVRATSGKWRYSRLCHTGGSSMTALPPRKITDEQDNPIIAALIAFVTDQLKRSVDDISNWSVVVSGSGIGDFDVRFDKDTTGYTGGISKDLSTGQWNIYEFRSMWMNKAPPEKS